VPRPSVPACNASKSHTIPEGDRAAYAAYSRAGRMPASWVYFVSFQRAAKIEETTEALLKFLSE
jgi:hypothetical protein